jgi:hypothetical protein
MKTKRSDQFWMNILTGAGVLAVLTTAGTAGAQLASPRVATILRVEGKARYSIDNQTWQPLKKGTVFNLGAVIQTADKARVDILLDDAAATDLKSGQAAGGDAAGETQTANVVRVLPDTVLAIDRLTAIRYDALEEVQLDLRSGQILASARKLTGTAKFEVKVANGVVGVRGGFFKVYSNGMVDVASGAVVAAEAIGDGSLATKLVGAGRRFDPVTGALSDAPPIDEKEKRAIIDSPSSSTANGNTPPPRRGPDISGGFRK